jgi:hypothetical protein
VEVNHKMAELDHKIQIKTDHIINFDKYALLMMVAAIPIQFIILARENMSSKIYNTVFLKLKHKHCRAIRAFKKIN